MWNDRTSAVIRLVPSESLKKDEELFSNLEPASQADLDAEYVAYDELSRHLKRIDDDFRTGQMQRLNSRARCVVLIADQLGMRHLGQVAADVVFCIEQEDENAVAATLSRLIRLMTQTLDETMGPMTVF